MTSWKIVMAGPMPSPRTASMMPSPSTTAPALALTRWNSSFADCGDLLIRPANEDEAREITAVRAEEDGLESSIAAARLLRGPEVHGVAEDPEPLGSRPRTI